MVFKYIQTIIKRVFNKELDKGFYEFNIDMNQFPKGTYYCRFRLVNQSDQRIIKLIKV